MSIYFSKFSLNTYSGTPYFQAHIPADYPLSLVLQKCRAFRRLPPRLRELSKKSKEWVNHIAPPGTLDDIDSWYDKDGYELNPYTGDRLTDAQIDAEWERWGEIDVKVKDIPVPDGGFPDPGTWKAPAPQKDEEEDGITEEQLVKDIASHGREYVAKEYGLPVEQLGGAKNARELARAILGTIGRV